jgi:uncharacterized protein
MYLLDVNVVVAGFREDHPRHREVRTWLDDLWAAEGQFAVPAGVWASLLRLVTHRRIFPVTSTLDETFAFIEAVCAEPGYLPLAPGARHIALLRELSDDAAASGDLVPDAVLAAVATEHGCVIVTLDRDFARFRTVEHLLL